MHTGLIAGLATTFLPALTLRSVTLLALLLVADALLARPIPLP